MSTRRNTSDADAADVASTEEAQGRGVSGRSSQKYLLWKTAYRIYAFDIDYKGFHECCSVFVFLIWNEMCATDDQ